MAVVVVVELNWLSESRDTHLFNALKPIPIHVFPLFIPTSCSSCWALLSHMFIYSTFKWKSSSF